MDHSRVPEPGAGWPLHGRDEELARLTRALTEERCKGLVVFGQAGVGKSRLAEEILAVAERSGFRTGRAVASTAAGTVPLGAIAHLLPTGVDLSDPVRGFAAVADALRGVSGDGSRGGSDERRSGSGSAARGGPGSSGPRSRPRPGRDRRAPTAVFVDDIHLLDATSAMLLRQLMDAGVITLIATIRTGEEPNEAVEALTSGEAIHHAELGVFDLRRTEGLLEKVLGGPVGSTTVRDLHEVSGGNVLFLRELVRGALENGALTSDGEVWEARTETWEEGTGAAPATRTGTHTAAQRTAPWTTLRLSELIRVKVDAVAGPGRDALELLACCGALPLAALETAAPQHVLTDLERDGLIRFGTDGRRTRVSLAHPLYEEVLRNAVPALRHRAIQLEQAARIEEFGARRRGDALRIATWRLDATGKADPALLLRAAHLAHYAHDHPRTLTFLNALPESHHDAGTRLVQGEAYFLTGSWDLADAVLAQAGETARDEAERIAITVTRTTNLLVSNAPLDEILEVNEAARTAASFEPVRELLLVNEGFIRLASGQPVAGLKLLELLEPEAYQALDRRMWLCAAAVRTLALVLVGRVGDAVEWAERAHAAHVLTDEESRPAHPAVQQGTMVLALAEGGRLAEAAALGESVSSELARHSPLLRIFPALLNARTQWLAGHPATARRMYAELAALARRERQAKLLRIALSGLAACAAVLGDPEAAGNALTELDSMAGGSPGYLSVGEERLGEAWLSASGGHRSKARKVLLEAAEAARSTGHITSEGLLLTDVARLGGAADVAARLAEIAQRCDGALASVRARLAAALAAGEPEQLMEASEELEALGAHLPAAEAAAAAARVWLRRGERRRATAASVRSGTVAETHCEGARTPLLETVGAAASLTDREREIADLAAAGEQSKEIAAELALSVRTVDNHLQKAYAKLGIATRRELAARLGHLGQAGPGRTA
ncbi:LuxR C-terminal-related transcriptional regulator [Streptomyces marispadix]|uniref:LuxR C-terminal-related transcriptional regulator n=1 Tax=Streptomyces marispadix TaxID=2922868 RepID=A0ABS9SYG2_9ACTN|nr:LuxR family transcriptional regulator [Streptomyces marispadix]MCH6161312.1 LuxR C-terminal-related transcriptional regulator [Streptomyces marispadix]